MDSLTYSTRPLRLTRITTSELCWTRAWKRCSLARSSAVRSTTRDSRCRASEEFSSKVSTWRPIRASMMNDRTQPANEPRLPCCSCPTVLTTSDPTTAT